MKAARGMWPSLCRPEAFRAAIDKLLRASSRDDDGELAVLQRDRGALARRLAADFAARRWEQRPVARRVVMLDRPRELTALDTVDKVVHSAVGTALTRALEPQLPACLYSYRPRRGSETVVRVVGEALRAYRARGLPIAERGLYVMRFDVEKYGDTVPVGDDSALWPMLERALPGEDPWMIALVQRMVRGDGERTVGAPIGSPMANPILNLYLVDLDVAVAKLATLYVRFGDDCLVVCESAAQADVARAEVDRVLAARRLRLNPAKVIARYWTGCGRPSADGWRGTSHVSYVGADISFGGVVRLKLARRRAFLAELRARVAALAGLLDAPDADGRAGQLCRALVPAFDVSSSFALPELGRVLSQASCRQQLAEIDREIAVVVAGAAAGRSGAAAFRTIAWRRLYELGLPSLVAMRNRPAPR